MRGFTFYIKKNMEKKINLIKQKITGLSKTQLFISPKIDSELQKKIENATNRLINWEPIEYIINNAEFYSLDFYVNNNVLIPRNDTEIMVDKAIEEIVNIPKEIDKTPNITLIDIWTWTSCIAISILKNTYKVNNSYVIDISEKALNISKKNIIKHKLENNIYQIHWNLLNEFLLNKEYEISKNIIITANLPYIKDNDFINIDTETIKYEPALALYWWKKTWFELYEKLIKECILLKNNNINKKIVLFIEIWFDQKEICKNFVNNMSLTFEIYKDNWWIERCVKIEF